MRLEFADVVLRPRTSEDDFLFRHAQLLPEELNAGYFRRSRIFSKPARAQPSSRSAPGAPAAPIAPTTSSPILITNPPPNSRVLGSFASSGEIGAVFARSTRALVSDLKEAAV